MDGIVEDDRAGQTCQRSISDRYLTPIIEYGGGGKHNLFGFDYEVGDEMS